MERRMKKWALCVCMVLAGTIGWSYPSKAANDTTMVQVEAIYGQTEARRMGQMINDFRTSTTDAWYWNKDGTKTVYNSGSNTKLGTLTYDYDLEAIAMQRAAEIALNWAHTRPNGERCFTATSNGHRSYAENIAIGYSSVDSVFTGWQEKDDAYDGQGHRRNMLNSELKSVGVGYAVVNGVQCWVQEFSYSTYNTVPVTDRDGKKRVSVELLNSNLSSVKAVPSQSIVSTLVGGNIELPTIDTTIMLKNTWSYVGDIPVTTAYEWNVENENVAKMENGRIVGVSEGTTRLVTTILGEKVVVTVNVLSQEEKEHTYDSGVITKEPDCIGKGVKTYTCTGCGDTYTEEIPALGHDWPDTNSYTVVTSATCTVQGKGRRYCKHGCGWYFEVDIPATGHTYDNGVIIRKPSCTEKGTKQYTCIGCGASYTEEIPATGHTKVIDPAVPATATTTGLTEGSHCSVCSKIFKYREVVPKITAPSSAHPGNDQTFQNQTSTTESETTTNSSQYSDVKGIDTEDRDKDWKEKDVQEGDYEEYDSLAEVEAVRKTKIIKIKATKKGFTVRWKGIARACNGYEVAYSTKKSMKGAKNVRLASDKKICKVKKLKAKKKYYVRIRTYRIVKVNATYKRVYSAWSKIKTVRTK